MAAPWSRTEIRRRELLPGTRSIPMGRERRRPSRSAIRISICGRSAAPAFLGGNTDRARRCISCGRRSATASISSAISTSAATGLRSSGIGRLTSFRSRGRTGSDGSASLDYVAGRQDVRRLGGRFPASHCVAGRTPVDAANPPGADTAHIDVDERTTAPRVRIKAGAPHELWIACLDSLDRIQDHLDVREGYLPVAIQVRHLAVPFLVDIDVGGIAELVPAIAGASLAADGEVVGRGPEPRAN